MSESRYIVRPKADAELEDQAYYYATAGGAEVGHRFWVAAHDTFAILATQPSGFKSAHPLHSFSMVRDLAHGARFSKPPSAIAPRRRRLNEFDDRTQNAAGDDSQFRLCDSSEKGAISYFMGLTLSKPGRPAISHRSAQGKRRVPFRGHRELARIEEMTK